MVHSITLRDEHHEDGSAFTLTASVADNGVLSLVGLDSGPMVQRFWSCEDYEYSRHVDAEWVPTVLLQLLKERFVGEKPFADWLASHGIPSRFGNWQWGLR